MIAFLPPGLPFFPLESADPETDPSPIPPLLASIIPSAKIITISYRQSDEYPYTFPQPIHYTSVALDYITSPKSPHNAGTTPRVSLFGNHIGGALATMLTLTQPSLVHALAVSEPIANWAELDDAAETALPTLKQITKRKTKYVAKPNSYRLLTVRSAFFRNAEGYFDPFASPMLFLRAPGRDCPNENPDPFHVTRSTSPEAYGPYDDDMSSSRFEPVKRRKVLKRWPPDTLEETLLPYTRVFVEDGKPTDGETCLLQAQGRELVDLMRKTCFYGREKGVAEERASLGLLGGKERVAGILGVTQAAEWLKSRLEDVA